jgi:hypothetical protein
MFRQAVIDYGKDEEAVAALQGQMDLDTAQDKSFPCACSARECSKLRPSTASAGSQWKSAFLKGLPEAIEGESHPRQRFASSESCLALVYRQSRTASLQAII